MPPQEPHTVVRVKLRSLLAITAGQAVVLAVASPFIRQLENERKIQLGLLMVGVGLGMCLSFIMFAKALKKAGSQSGPLLLELQLKNKSRRYWLKWFWLLGIIPGVVLYVFVLVLNKRNTFLTPIIIGVSFFYSMASWGIHLWTEGNNRTAKLCEKGLILYDSRFYAWDSPALRSFYWGQVEGRLVINISRAVFTVFVPEAQRDEVNAILEKYYWSKKASTKEPAEGVSSRITSSEG